MTLQELKNWKEPSNYKFVMVMGVIGKYTGTFFSFVAVIGFYYLWFSNVLPSQLAFPMILGVNWLAIDYVWDSLVLGGYYGGHSKGFKEGMDMASELYRDSIRDFVEEVKNGKVKE